MRVGSGYDIHALGAARPLKIGGAVVAPDGGPVGHSDGDVVYHALIDALFGAVAAGDIGGAFSDQDPRFKDADSAQLARQAYARVTDAGFALVNLDVTVLLARPKLAGAIASMRANVAQALAVGVERVSIKAKSGNGLGPVGEGRAVEAHAVVLLREATPGATP